MKNRILVLIFLLFCASLASAQTRYVDFSTGSDLWDGTSKTNTSGTVGPWKSSPYMQGAAGCSDNSGNHFGYSHTAGQQIIFKGGVTWPAACFQLSIPDGGTGSGVQDYYGVDLTWFTGGSFTRPIFDMANTTPVGNSFIKVRAKWITFDNIEMKRMQIVSGIGECNDANMDLGTPASGNITVKNMFIHDWTITALVAGSTSHGTASICQNRASGPIRVDSVTMDDAATTAVVPFGACFRNLGEIKNSSCQHTGEGEVGVFGPVHDSIFANINGAAVQAHDTVNHTNIFEISGPGNSVTIYNNLIYNNNAGVTMFLCDIGNVYNNVMWSNSNDSIKVVPNGAFCGTYSSSDVLNVYNNTIDCSNRTLCFGVSGGKTTLPGTVNLQNNHFITNSSPIDLRGNTITTFNQTPNLTMNTKKATSQGYTAATKYKGFPVSAPTTVGVGVNLTSLATGPLVALSCDAGGAFWSGLTCVSRPTGSTNWDYGAYQSPGNGGGSPPKSEDHRQ